MGQCLVGLLLGIPLLGIPLLGIPLLGIPLHVAMPCWAVLLGILFRAGKKLTPPHVA
jgi:hypothetical protein